MWKYKKKRWQSRTIPQKEGKLCKFSSDLTSNHQVCSFRNRIRNHCISSSNKKKKLYDTDYAPNCIIIHIIWIHTDNHPSTYQKKKEEKNSSARETTTTQVSHKKKYYEHSCMNERLCDVSFLFAYPTLFYP